MPETEVQTQNEPVLDEPVANQQVPEAEKPEPTQDSETEIEQEKKGKGGFSKKIDKLTARNYQLQETNAQLQQRLEAIERRLEGEKAPAKPTASDEPKLDDFKNETDPWDSYYKALARYQAKVMLEEREKENAKQNEEHESKQKFDSYNKRVSEARGKYEDFDEVVGQAIELPETAGLAIVELDNGPEVAYFLGQHPEKCQELIEMKSPFKVIQEIGRIADSLNGSTSPEQRPVSRAAAPVKPVGSSSTKSSVSLEDLPQREYNRIRNEQEAKRRYR
jgi:hypothetical protein